MKKAAILTVVTAVVCILISGCGAGIAIPGDGSAMELSRGVLYEHSTYFNRYSSEKGENTCRVQGTIHQAADDQHGGLTCVTAVGGNGSLAVTGSMECEKGSIRLIYIAPDGTETLIAEGTDRKMDVQVDVAEGEGGITFASDGKSSVCTFDIKVEAGENVNLSGSMEEGESIENLENVERPEKGENIEKSEVIEAPEMMEVNPDFAEGNDKLEESEAPLEEEVEDLESIGIEEIEDNWPRSIRYRADGIYADPMSVVFQIDNPMMASLTCKTRDGKLRLKLIGPGDSEAKVCFDETDPDGTYTVSLDRPGEYQLLFYAKYHVGSVEIVPIEE